MTFEERCLVFERNTEKEINQFKKVYRYVFIQKKKEEQRELESSLFAIMLQKEEEERKANRKK